tara:strand:- start:144 stop:494 length:351 start_codon:yes stop_codon:yes gene_type:complete
MMQFSKNTFKNAQVVFQVKEELKATLAHNDFDEIDLYQFANELVAAMTPKPEVDIHRDPGMRRDYRNYDVDKAFSNYENEVFYCEQKLFDSNEDDYGLTAAMVMSSIDQLGGAIYA